MKWLAVLTICLVAMTFAARRFKAEGLRLPFHAQASEPSSGPTNSSAEQVPAATAPTKHAITIKFDYDFKKTPACTAKLTKKCVSEFNVYDISSGAQRRFKLLSIPAPNGATGEVQGITGTTPARVFESGKHLIAV